MSGMVRHTTGCGPLTAAFRSAPVITADTPGNAAALLTSIDTIRACGTGLRRIAASSMPGTRTSSTNCARPVSSRTSSLLLTRAPIKPSDSTGNTLSSIGVHVKSPPARRVSGVAPRTAGRHRTHDLADPELHRPGGHVPFVADSGAAVPDLRDRG